jgi:hypothetical protein
MKNSFFIFLFVGFYTCVNAQANLVMNPGFEEDSGCTNLVSGIAEGFCYYWSSASNDPLWYMNICANNYISPFNYVIIPKNLFGHEYPHSGVAYTCFGPYATYGGGQSFRQYLQGTLKDTLIPGKRYGIEFYLSKSEFLGYYRFCISNIGIAFTKNKLSYNTYEIIPEIPNFKNDTNNVLSDTLGWQKVEGSFIARGGERYFSIGNFDYNAHTKIFDCFNNGTSLYSPIGEIHYYIDDVSVIDTSIIDTVQLCMNDSLFLQGAWRKTAGIYYDTIAGMPYQKYLQPKTYASTHTNFFFEGVPTDSFKTGYFWSHIFSQKDTTFSIIMPSIHGCDSVLVFRLRDRSIGIANRPAYTNNDYVSLLIYPNPAEQFINIEVSSSQYLVSSIIIYDAIGRTTTTKVIQEETVSNKGINTTTLKINIKELNSGLYFVKVYDKNNRNIANGKFICR